MSFDYAAIEWHLEYGTAFELDVQMAGTAKDVVADSELPVFLPVNVESMRCHSFAKLLSSLSYVRLVASKAKDDIDHVSAFAI